MPSIHIDFQSFMEHSQASITLNKNFEGEGKAALGVRGIPVTISAKIVTDAHAELTLIVDTDPYKEDHVKALRFRLSEMNVPHRVEP